MTKNNKKESRPKPNLLRAREIIQEDGRDEGNGVGGDKWETGLPFDELRGAIGKAFAGIPGKVEGEPACHWILGDLERDIKVRDEAMTFLVSVPLYEAMVRRRYLDLSIRTESGLLASTAVIYEYQPKSGLAKWWDKVAGKYHETVLVVKLWRRGQLPELVVSKEWKDECETLFRRGHTAVADTTVMHGRYGPPHLHWYVNFVASNPDLQGQGYGSRLMRKICDLADKEGADCYLECSSVKNKKFYEKFGFVEVGTNVLEDRGIGEAASDTIKIYLMVRRHQA
jgi:ribosomal protein S18 acetylase RimI-like enzyme